MSSLLGSWRPPSTKTDLTSGILRMSAPTRSVTATVSARREPGASSTTKAVRAESSLGRKPEGRSVVENSEAVNSARPAARVVHLWRTDQPTSRP